ncbi:hypothetical protein JW933_08775 [candidate division FCPU426 bacterium]|nr:hypothetical protein [candidate division FCPU426 bacterium]
MLPDRGKMNSRWEGKTTLKKAHMFCKDTKTGNERNMAGKSAVLWKKVWFKYLAVRAKQKYPEIQLQIKEVFLICNALANYAKPNFMIFGAGYDTPLWTMCNRGGRTVFLEDDRAWYEKIKGLCPGAEIYPVNYHTVYSQWEELIDREEELQIPLPPAVMATPWDVILVDGPCGAYAWSLQQYGVEPPGRMASIFMASRLARNGGDIFIHDCDRTVERVYADRYLQTAHLQKEIRGRTIMRHYRLAR